MSDAFTPEQQAERERLALFSTYEIDAIGQHLRGNLPKELEYRHLRCMVLRILELNSVAMSVMGCDDECATEEMRRVVEGLA